MLAHLFASAALAWRCVAIGLRGIVMVFARPRLILAFAQVGPQGSGFAVQPNVTGGPRRRSDGWRSIMLFHTTRNRAGPGCVKPLANPAESAYQPAPELPNEPRS